MEDTFRHFDWRVIGAALDVDVDAGQGESTVTLRAGPRCIVIDDNGGEFNTRVLEPDGTCWAPDFSVAYVAGAAPIGPVTMAYRIACHAQDRQIDYRVDLDTWPTDLARAAALRALADRIERDTEPTTAPPCGDELAPITGLWEPGAGRLTFEIALRRDLGIDDDAYAAVVAGVWASGRPRQFSALGRAIAAAPIVGSRDVIGSRE